MSPSHADPTWSRTSPRGLGLAAVGSALAVTLLIAMAAFPLSSQAATPQIDLGTADSFAVLAGSGITNTGATTILGDVGSHPTPTQTGFDGLVTLTGTNHGGDAVTEQAKIDLVTAYNTAASGSPTEIRSDLAGLTLVPGVYRSADGTFGNTGELTLDGQGLTDPVFVFQTTETLITDTDSSVTLIGNAAACNVYWQIGSSATLGTSSSLVGTIMALASITLDTGATVDGRVLARDGAVTMDNNTITRTGCTTTTVESSDSTTVAGEPVTLTATVTADDASTPTGDVEFFDGDTSLGTAPLVGGSAELTTTTLDAGTRTITSVYLGAPGHDSSTSDALTQTVQGAGAPTAPAVPAEPTPAVPSAPTAPAAPSAPTPAAPSAPVAPAAPAEPAAPSAPTEPAAPSAPTEPAAPSAPTAPGVPTSPPAPVTPGVPQFAG